MTSAIYNLYEAKTSLSKLVDRAAAGEEIVIAKAGKPLARLTPLASAHPIRKPGVWEGKVRISDDFDDPLPDSLLDAFEGRASQSRQEKHGHKLVGERIIDFASLLTTQLATRDTHCVLQKEGQYFLADPTRASPDETNDGSRSDHEVLLGETLTEAIQKLPEVLESDKVKYRSYQQLLQAVQEGLAPRVLQRVVQLPFEWQRNRAELQCQYGSSLDSQQKSRLKDFTDSFSRLRESLGALQERLCQRRIEQQLPHRNGGEEEEEQVSSKENLGQSIKILEAFSKTWQWMENRSGAPDIPRSFQDPLQQLPPPRLEEVLESLKT